MRSQSAFRRGFHAGLPIGLGYFSVSLSFGILAVSYGFSWWQAVLISMLCVTSAGQLAAVPIIATQGSLIELAVSQLVINLRYALMSISLSQKMDKDMTTPHRMAFAFINTDEVFAVASSQGSPVNKAYLYGLILTPWLGWSVGTLLGALAGNILPAIVTSSLSVAIYGMFIAIVVPEMKASRPTAICVCIAVALSCGFYFIPMLQAVPSGFVIIICACIASVIMAIVAPIPQEVTK